MAVDNRGQLIREIGLRRQVTRKTMTPNGAGMHASPRFFVLTTTRYAESYNIPCRTRAIALSNDNKTNLIPGSRGWRDVAKRLAPSER